MPDTLDPERTDIYEPPDPYSVGTTVPRQAPTTPSRGMSVLDSASILLGRALVLLVKVCFHGVILAAAIKYLARG